VVAKLDRGYDDYVTGKISEQFWERRSDEWEAELQAIDDERASVDGLREPITATARGF